MTFVRRANATVMLWAGATVGPGRLWGGTNAGPINGDHACFMS